MRKGGYFWLWLRQEPMTALVSAMVFLFPVLALTVNRADSVIVLLLSFCGIALWLRDGFWKSLSSSERRLCGAFTLMFAIALLSYLAGEQTYRGYQFLGRYLRWFMFIPLLLLFLKIRSYDKAVWWGIVLGAIINCTYAIWVYRVAPHQVRIAGDDNSIVFGNLSLTLGFMALAAYRTFSVPWKLLRYVLLILTFVSALVASLLSGARGGWISIPFMAMLLIWLLPQRHRLIMSATVALALVCIMLFVVFNSSLPANSRISDIWTSLQTYSKYSKFSVGSGNITKDTTCMSNKFDLEGLLHSVRSPKWADLGIDKYKGTAVSTMPNCHVITYLSLKSKAKRVAWAAVPRWGESGGYTIVLARGKGRMAFRPGANPPIHINTESFQRYKIGPTSRANQDLILYALPKMELDVIPVGTYFGEYHYFYAKSSLGARLEMWRAAWNIFLNHPVLGAGTGAWQVKAKQLVKTGKYAPNIADYDHPHNQYLNELAMKGIVGMASLILLFSLLAAESFVSMRRHGNIEGAPLALLVLLMGFSIFCLTETMFVHSSVLNWFVFYTAVFVAMMNKPKKFSANN